MKKGRAFLVHYLNSWQNFELIIVQNSDLQLLVASVQAMEFLFPQLFNLGPLWSIQGIQRIGVNITFIECIQAVSHLHNGHLVWVIHEFLQLWKYKQVCFTPLWYYKNTTYIKRIGVNIVCILFLNLPNFEEKKYPFWTKIVRSHTKRGIYD